MKKKTEGGKMADNLSLKVKIKEKTCGRGKKIFILGMGLFRKKGVRYLVELKQHSTVILTKLLKIAMLHVVLDCKKIYEIVLEKEFFFFFVAFLSLFGSCVEKLEQHGPSLR